MRASLATEIGFIFSLKKPINNEMLHVHDMFAGASRINRSHDDAPDLSPVIKLLSNNMPQIELTH